MKTIKSKQRLALVLMMVFFCTLTAQQKKQKLGKDKILFVHLSMKKESRSMYSVNLLKQKTVPGKFKKRFAKYKVLKEAKEGDVIVTVLDKNRRVLSQVVKENPLTRFVEYPEGNTFQKKQLQLAEGKLAVRLQLSNKAAFISVQRMDSSGRVSSDLLNFKIDSL